MSSVHPLHIDGGLKRSDSAHTTVTKPTVTGSSATTCTDLSMFASTSGPDEISKTIYYSCCESNYQAQIQFMMTSDMTSPCDSCKCRAEMYYIRAHCTCADYYMCACIDCWKNMNYDMITSKTKSVKMPPAKIIRHDILSCD